MSSASQRSVSNVTNANWLVAFLWSLGLLEWSLTWLLFTNSLLRNPRPDSKMWLPKQILVILFKIYFVLKWFISGLLFLGYHVGKMMEDFDIIQRNFHFKPDEIFPRIKISLLVSLICESVYLESTESPQTKSEELEEAAAAVTTKSTLSSYRTYPENE